MKQILSKCFGKMKRVALTLFAALCVGSVWAGYITLDARNLTLNEAGDATFECNFGYYGSGSTRHAYLEAEFLDADGNEKATKRIIYNEGFVDASNLLVCEGETGWRTITLQGTPFTSLNEFYGIRLTFKSFKPNETVAKSAGYGIGQASFVPNIGISNVKERYVYNTYEFTVSGNYDTTLNFAKIKLYYSLNSEACDRLIELDLENDGTFEAKIEYSKWSDVLTYKLVAVYLDGTEKIAYSDRTALANYKFARPSADTTKIIYTWTGNGDGTSWQDVRNWDTTSDQAVGFPGTHDGSYYRTLIYIPKDVECIDLQGGTYGFPDDGGMFISANKTVKFKNGKLRFTNGGVSRTRSDLSGDSSGLIGSNGGTLIFENVLLRHCTDSGSELDKNGAQLILGITPRSGATIVFEGTYGDTYWDYYPMSAQTGTKIIIRDGQFTVGRNLNTYANGSQNDVLISNAKWNINNASTKTLTPYKTLTFRDGPDRQAQVVNTGDLKLLGTYDFALPATPYSTPYYTLRSLASADAGTIKVDVTNYKGGGLVPLIKFTGTLNDNTKSAMNTITTTASKLKVTANGEDVKTARNAKLVWNETAKTLYFQQDSQNAASIGTTEYATLGAAVEAATSGATITVLNDCTADTACVIANKTLTIDLNGKTVKANDTDAATDGNGVFWVQASGVLTLEDSSEDKSGTVDGNGGNGYKMAIWADGGKVVINAGNYVNDNDGTHNQYDLIYAKNGGEIVINGGTFKCATPRWTLNSHNTNTGTFVVTGGKFYQYNPTDFDTDEAVTTWCDAKYRAEADGDWYVIKEGYTVTEESAATVTADTEAEALAQVDFSVTTPEGVDAAAYKNYFKLVATETAEGSKTWTVALALKDELKPVIAETTPAITFNDDGTVTVNIENELPGLNYGVRYATTVEAVETTAPVAGFTVTPGAGDTAGFFKVVVDFKPIVAE